MTKTLKDYFKEFEHKVAGIEEIIEGEYGRIRAFDSTKHSIFKNFSLVKGFIKAQYNLENQRDLWHTAIDLLNDSKAFNSEIKEEVRERLLVYCFAELENLNNTILQLQTQKNKTKPDEKFNWQGTQAQLVFLIEQLYEHGFLSPITQSEKFSLLSQHFTVKGESLNPKTLAQIKQNSLTRKGGKPKDVERIEQIVSDTKKQKP